MKNQQRFNFGIVAPPACGGTSHMRTECLIEGDRPVIDVCVRCLHLLSREVFRLKTRSGDHSEDNDSEEDHEPVASLQIGSEMYQTWQEAVERDVRAESLQVTDLVGRFHSIEFSFAANQDSKTIYDEDKNPHGLVARRQEAVEGTIALRAESMKDGHWKVCVEIKNTTSLPMQPESSSGSKASSLKSSEISRSHRNEGLLSSLVSTHTILGVRDGQFVSLLDPTETCAESAAKCNNVGTWPVLVGMVGQRDMLLSSPIILYDYPQIAPESDGDFYDGLEIDEMLALRVMTMTDEEKREMRQTDIRARQILERTEGMLSGELQKLHGAIRHLKPSKRS